MQPDASAPKGGLVVAGVRVTYEDGIPHLDLRALEPPQPAVAILTLIDRPDAGDVVIARLPREPVFLYPELVERGWSWTRLEAPLDEFRLRLTRGRREPPR